MVVVAPARTGTVFSLFLGYGMLWGPYLAMLPEIRRVAGANDAQLALAMLIGALVAVPAMAGVGRLLDAVGRPAAVAAVGLFAVVAPLPSIVDSVPTLIGAVALFGFGSGACNVALVALAAAAEAGSGRPVMNRAHALFSVGLLAGSLATSGALAIGLSGRAMAVALAAAFAVGVVRCRHGMPRRFAVRKRVSHRRIRLGRVAALISVVAALAMVLESGVQQWSAVFLTDTVGVSPALAAAMPGLFAAAMAAGRFAGHWLISRTSARTVLRVAGVLAGAGVLLLATAAGPAPGLAGVTLVGAAVSVVTPTSYTIVGHAATPDERGSAIGSVASLASIGLLLGPAAVGQVASWTDQRTAVAALSVVALAICLLARWIPHKPTTGGAR
ncbi:MFS transporter [Actinocrispum wychmicini]|uniref:MFS transporter n=1 Tax=Actinocrispum wychmicini TaxID=1213861 RepID=A0A4R2IT38_9PSEU|nr:MFS transporter [Actinocrispum wychmicini]TCO47419.1 MFS transporter [Actinocrispum wychmicini]